MHHSKSAFKKVSAALTLFQVQIACDYRWQIWGVACEKKPSMLALILSTSLSGTQILQPNLLEYTPLRTYPISAATYAKYVDLYYHSIYLL